MALLTDEILAACARDEGEAEGDRLLRCADLLERICARNQHAELLNEYLAQHLSNDGLADDEYKEILTSGRFLILGQSQDAMIVVLRQPYVVDQIHSAPIRFVERNLSDGPIDFATYSLPDGFREDEFDPAVRLVPLGTRSGVEHAMIVKDLREVIDFTMVATLPRISLRIAFPLEGRYEWSFSRDTLAAVSYTSLSLAASGMADMLDLLSSMRSPQTGSVVAELRRHPEHFVRWKAIQTMGRIDRSRGLAMVREALDDPHPGIRRAAKETLAREELKMEANRCL